MLEQPKLFKLPKSFYPAKESLSNLIGSGITKADAGAILVGVSVGYTVTIFATGFIIAT